MSSKVVLRSGDKWIFHNAAARVILKAMNLTSRTKLRRLPKRGFLAVLIVKAAEVRSGDLARVPGETIDLESLKKAGLVPAEAKRAKIILAGAKVEKKLAVSGIAASKGAKAAIESAGGSVAAIEEIKRPAKLVAKQKPAQAAAK